MKLLNIPYVKTDAYGTQSAKYHCVLDWYNFKKTFSNLSLAEHRNPKIKALLKKALFKQILIIFRKTPKFYHASKDFSFSFTNTVFFRTVIYYYYHN